jgi:SAM-dependent methyltransferase
MVKKTKPKVNYQTLNQLTYSGHEELYATEVGLQSYSKHIVNEFSKRLQAPNGDDSPWKLLEFGAGTGFLAELWKSNFQIIPDCIEIDPILVSIITERNFNCFSNISDLKSKYDAVYSSNVLEHIEDDERILHELRDILIDNGKIGVYVPALPILFSEMDRRVGHFRRYTKKELVHKVESAGFEILSVSYVDSVGVLASLLIKVFGFKGKSPIGSVASLKVYDRFVFPVSRFFDRLGFQHLVGKNLLVVAKKSKTLSIDSNRPN